MPTTTHHTALYHVDVTATLARLLPSAAHGSHATLYGTALARGLVTRGEYDDARVWYGALWDYAGD